MAREGQSIIRSHLLLLIIRRAVVDSERREGRRGKGNLTSTDFSDLVCGGGWWRKADDDWQRGKEGESSERQPYLSDMSLLTRLLNINERVYLGSA